MKSIKMEHLQLCFKWKFLTIFIYYLLVAPSAAGGKKLRRAACVLLQIILFIARSIILLMQQLLLRHFQASTAATAPQTDLWIRVTCTLTLLVTVLTAATVGRKTKETSDKYFLPTTPPDYFFRIWIVIYLLFVFVMVYGLIENCWSVEIWILFAVIHLCCGVWAVTFNSGHLWGVNVSILCQFVNLAANELIWIELGDVSKNALQGTTMGFIFRNIIAFCNGWFIAAAALGLFIILVYDFGLSLKLQLLLFWIAAPIVYAGFLIFNIIAIGTLADTLGLLLSMCWAVLGAFIASTKQPQNILQPKSTQ